MSYANKILLKYLLSLIWKKNLLTNIVIGISDIKKFFKSDLPHFQANSSYTTETILSGCMRDMLSSGYLVEV